MGAYDPGHGQFGPNGCGWQDLCRRSLNIATYKICISGPFGFRDFESSMLYSSLYIYMTPWGVASLDPRGLLGRIYVGDH